MVTLSLFTDDGRYSLLLITDSGTQKFVHIFNRKAGPPLVTSSPYTQITSLMFEMSALLDQRAL